MIKSLFVLSALSIFSVAQAAMGNSRDVSTYANIEEVYATHVDMDFLVDFDRQVLDGYVVINFTTAVENVQSVFLDAEGLYITNVQYKGSDAQATWRNVNFFMTRPNGNLGDAVEALMPETLGADAKFQLKLTYVTNEKTTAISWLKPSQTAGQQHPYLFTQCEDIACRSVAPLQDTPAIKVTYTSKVTVAKPLVAHMSANRTSMTSNDTHNMFEFDNQIMMPSYLIALAVGNLEERSIDARTSVITEPEKMDEVAETLSSLGTLLNKTETYLTPYIWGNYSIIVLPPSFPMGGMENPLLTFASPTIITSDKSQVYVATHEIAHSWTGNDVTCENWSNLWLNEGFTVFEERKVSAELHGEDFSKVNAYLGNISMYQDMLEYGLNNSYASLYPVIGVDKPDNSFSEIPYEKGFQLLYFLENEVMKDPAAHQEMLQTWINKYKQTSQNYTAFQQHFEDYVRQKFPDTADQMIAMMDWDVWVRQGGLPPNKLDFTTVKLNESKAMALAYIDGGGDTSPSNYLNYKDYDSSLKVIFLEEIIDNPEGVTLKVIGKIDTDLNVTESVDPEVKQRWFPMGITLGYDKVMQPAKDFVQGMGRWKYVKPIYKALVDNDKRDTAIEWFQEKEDFYHPYVVEQLRKLLGLNTEEGIVTQQPSALVKKWEEKFLSSPRFIN